ncbi:glutamate--cysteine ligase [Streptomyces sp. WAC06614]|uniref:carboxylate-amine ligase n=1 Tax=Streptomyces sp. WAC06614 TaxID=2487416 RepID=UPI00163D144E|nr:glutamate--cysteine ligase [Streptomyces sp. WAC06614]
MDTHTTATAPHPAPAAVAAAPLTLGVEEELLLVDATTWRPAPLAAEVLAAAGGPGPHLQGEGTPYQVELATPVAATAAELRVSLGSLRAALAGAARDLGCRLVASPVPVLGPDGAVELTADQDRQRAMQDHFGALNQTLIGCGRHVHVGPLDTAGAVAVSNRIRAWVPTLITLSANSPYAYGRDSGHASWRTVAWSGWPTAGPTPYFDGVAGYERTVRRLLDVQAVLDPHMLYWDLRPSRKWPTLELRAPDVTPDAEHAVLLAVLGRALVSTALRAQEEELPLPPAEDEVLRLARWRAAHDGLEGAGVDPCTGTEVPAIQLATRLLEALAPALDATGDLDFAADALDGLLCGGSWAARQRGVFSRRGDMTDVLRFLAEETERP